MPTTSRHFERHSESAADAFRPDIEGLRGVAILLVVAFHIGLPGVHGGFVGVDVFFVISGYVISARLRSELADDGRISLQAFFARRVRRLVPLAALVLLVTLGTSALLLPPLDVGGVATTVRAAAAYVSNEHFRRLASDYFSGDVRSNPLLHTWSLAVEEQFYLVWPLLMLGAAKVRRGRSAPDRHLAWLFVFVGIVSFAAACAAAGTRQATAFYSMPLRAWEFAIGSLSAVACAQRPRIGSTGDATRLARIAEISGLLLVLFAAAMYSAATEFPGFSALAPVVGTGLVITAGAWGGGAVRLYPVLAWRPVRWLGQRSYGWYLWHWPALAFVLAYDPTASLLAKATVAVAALGLASVTYRYVEEPLRTRRPSTLTKMTNARVLLLGGGATAVVIVTSIGASAWASANAHGPEQAAYAAAMSDVAQPYHEGCVADTDDDHVRVCRYGDVEGPLIVLYGDSHAAQWFPAVAAIARAHRWRLAVVAKTQCAVAHIPAYLSNPARRFPACERWRSAAEDSIVALRPQLVLVANAARYVLDPRRPILLPTVSASAWAIGLEQSLARFAQAGLHPVLIRDTPHIHSNVPVPVCLARSSWIGRVADRCGEPRTTAFNPALIDAERRAVAGVAGATVIDLTDAICGRAVCSPLIDGRVAYSDGDHMTATVVVRLSQRLARALDAATAPLLVDDRRTRPVQRARETGVDTIGGRGRRGTFDTGQ